MPPSTGKQKAAHQALRTTFATFLTLLISATLLTCNPAPTDAVETPRPPADPPIPSAPPTGVPVTPPLTGVPDTPGRPAIGRTWNGLRVAPEDRCADYDPDDYPYPQSVELKIVAGMSHVYSPYTGEYFAHPGETDIEHIVARSEAHDSGLCAASPAKKRAFASDLDNLTLASPTLNRHRKRDKDAAEWMPAMNRCWFANQVILVRQEYDLTIDPREAHALHQVLTTCQSVEMSMPPPPSTGPSDAPIQSPPPAPAIYHSCEEAESAGLRRVPGSKGKGRGFPTAQVTGPRDGDNDGVVCEK